MNKNSLTTWLHSILAAAIGGASNAALGAIAMPDTFNFSHAGLVNLGKIALIGALVPVLTLLKQSPLPGTVTDPAPGGVQDPGKPVSVISVVPEVTPPVPPKPKA